MRFSLLFLCLLAVVAAAPSAHGQDIQAEADAFLELYSSLYQRLTTTLSDAWWKSSTDVSPEHDGQRIAAGKSFAQFAGDPVVIERLRYFRQHADQLNELTVRQLEKAWMQAADSPGTVPELVAARIEAEAKQASAMDGYEYCLRRNEDGSCAEIVTANDIDDALVNERDLQKRLGVWESSKEIGVELRPGLAELQKLRNELAREMDYDSYFHLEVSDYGMTVDEMMAMLEGWIEDIWPLYLELHTWAKYTLAERYGAEPPKMIPAHWLGNRWGQSWPGLVESIDLDGLFAAREPEWLVEQAERFYVSMGFEKLPQSFWEKSDLYPVPEGDPRKKNTHASAWHMDLQNDVRSLMSVVPNSRWFTTTHHELGHIYYYIAYSTPQVPMLLREGANRGFHEGIGEQIAVAAMQVPYLREVGLLDESDEIDPILWLLDEALTQTITFIPWAAGTISHWEHDLYQDNLKESKWNERWWEYRARFQGITPPSGRSGALCDPATKTHVNDDPAQYYDYAVATVLKYQLHNHIAREILDQDPTACNYYGSEETGEFLRGILSQGATRNWRDVLREATGEELSTKPMMDYFAPLMAWLQEQNEGRQKGW